MSAGTVSAVTTAAGNGDRVDFPDTDALLRDDVRRLGAMVGRMLGEQTSPRLLALVEDVRRAAIARREDDAPVDALAARLAAVPLDDAEPLVRAFAAGAASTTTLAVTGRSGLCPPFAGGSATGAPSEAHASARSASAAALMSAISRVASAALFGSSMNRSG